MANEQTRSGVLSSLPLLLPRLRFLSSSSFFFQSCCMYMLNAIYEVLYITGAKRQKKKNLVKQGQPSDFH